MMVTFSDRQNYFPTNMHAFLVIIRNKSKTKNYQPQSTDTANNIVVFFARHRCVHVKINDIELDHICIYARSTGKLINTRTRTATA